MWFKLNYEYIFNSNIEIYKNADWNNCKQCFTKEVRK